MRLKLLSLLAFAAPLGAQQPPPVRLIAAPEASSKPTLGVVTAVRQLPNGGVLVNDITKRQLLLLDHSLGTATVIADSVSGGVNSYGPGPGAIVGYLGDSTLFIDPRDLSMFVIDPTGNIARVAAVPRSQDAAMLGSNILGSPALDSRGRLVYRGGFALRMPPRPSGTSGPAMPDFPDSSAIVRVDLVSRKLDTAGFYKIARQKMTMTQTDGRFTMTNEINPMPIVDEWAVLADGSIAVVRGRDYHVDVINADGTVTSAAKMPFEWQRLSDEDKVAVIDSSRTAMERARAAQAASASGTGAVDGLRTMVMSFSTGGDGPARSTAMAAGAVQPLTFITASELPDYRPAFNVGAAKADLDGNLWLRTTSVRAGAMAGPIYDVIDRKGDVVDRVQVPSGRTIVGFGPRGVVYMVARDDKGSWMERTHK
jgi:hypothetical protein